MNWTLGRDGKFYDDPKWVNIEHALDCLDNRYFKHVGLFLKIEGTEIYLQALGGNNDRVLVIFTDRSDESIPEEYSPVDPSQTKAMTISTHFDLKFTLAPYYFIDKPLAKRIFKHFFHHKERLLSVVWFGTYDDPTWEGNR